MEAQGLWDGSHTFRSMGITVHVEFVLVRRSLNIETYTTKIVK